MPDLSEVVVVESGAAVDQSTPDGEILEHAEDTFGVLDRLDGARIVVG